MLNRKGEVEKIREVEGVVGVVGATVREYVGARVGAIAGAWVGTGTAEGEFFFLS